LYYLEGLAYFKLGVFRVVRSLGCLLTNFLELLVEHVTSQHGF
jgi:hypothetical protein